MNWKRLVATMQIWLTLGCLSILPAGCNALVIVGLCRYFFYLDEKIALFWIGVPFFVLFSVLGIIYLPKRLYDPDHLTDDALKFGPWFRK